MLKNYFKIALRHLAKNKTYLIVNLLGLGIALACCIVAYLNVDFNRKFDHFHEHKDELYLVQGSVERDHGQFQQAITPLPIGPAIQENFAGVEKMSRVSSSSVVARLGDQGSGSDLHFAERDFGEMFTFELSKGNRQAFQDRSRIVITDEYAKKYFGDEDPIGKTISFRFKNEQERELIVGAIIKKLPLNSSLNFDILADFDIWKEVNEFKDDDWKSWAYSTFLQIPKKQTAEEVGSQLGRYVSIQNKAREDFAFASFYLQPFAQLAAHSRDENLRNNFMFQEATPPSALVGPSLMAVFILLIACFNFINTAIASSGRRLKEIGLRKVLGGRRYQLILQMLGENMLLCFLALWVGLGLAEFLVPAYSNMWDFLELELDYYQNGNLILFLFGLLMLTGFLGGAYPAFYVSGFEPTSIFKGKLKFGGNNRLSQVLLVLQFSISIGVVVMGIVFAQNAEFIEEADLGFDKELLIDLQISNEQEYAVMSNAATQHPDILGVAGGRNHLFYSHMNRPIEVPGKKATAQVLSVGPDYLETVGIRLLSGRTFDRKLATDLENAIILNELAVKELDLETPIGATVTFDSSDYRIIGVVENFYSYGFWAPLKPGILILGPEKDYRHLIVRAEADKLKGVFESLEKSWTKEFGGTPFFAFYQEADMLSEAKSVSDSIKYTSGAMAVAAVLLSVIGLFALVSLSIIRRSKEISIRKIFGASVGQISNLLSRQVIFILLISGIVAIPATWWLVNMLLDSIYDYHIEVGIGAFLYSTLLVLFAAAFTIGMKVYKAAMANPAVSLRDE